jgi:hypothetical protein
MNNILTLLVKDDSPLHIADYPILLITSAKHWLTLYNGDIPDNILPQFTIISCALDGYDSTKHLVYAVIIQLALLEVEEIETAADDIAAYEGLEMLDVHSGVILTNIQKR